MRPAQSHSLLWYLASLLLGLFAVALVAASVLGFVAGLPFYVLGDTARDESELRSIFSAGGTAGVGFGLLGTGLMVAMLLYTLRKWLLRWSFLGDVGHWLRFHIICGVMGPVFILLHTSFHWPRGLIAVGFWCMVLVAASGVFGRYVYGWFPRLAGGRAMAWNDAQERLADLRAELVVATACARGDRIGQAVSLVQDLDMEAHSVHDLMRLNRELLRRRAKMRSLLKEAELPTDVNRRASAMLAEQLRLKGGLESMRVASRMFRYWHLFHRPLAAAMYLIVAFHILGAVLFGGAFAPLYALVAS